jgi:hypothetical protein
MTDDSIDIDDLSDYDPPHPPFLARLSGYHSPRLP